ncbi:MAG: hypothetical protein GWO26_31495 [Phycisphaerae bacterium]|nr:hypothetical protein [Phycisphaerae bacterium]
MAKYKAVDVFLVDYKTGEKIKLDTMDSIDLSSSWTDSVTSTSSGNWNLSVDDLGPASYTWDYEGTWVGDLELAEVTDMKEQNVDTTMWELYAVNRRTLAYMQRIIFGPADDKEAALSAAILEHGVEIKKMLGDKAEEIEYRLVKRISFERIK